MCVVSYRGKIIICEPGFSDNTQQIRFTTSNIYIKIVLIYWLSDFKKLQHSQVSKSLSMCLYQYNSVVTCFNTD